MERPVEVALFQRGELQASRTLSPRREWRAAGFAALTTATVVLLAMVATAMLISTMALVVNATSFVLSWLGVAGGVAVIAARRARARARRFVLGVHMDADAFGSTEVDLVRRVGHRDEYDLGLVPGMVGIIDYRRAPMPIESLTRHGPVRVPLPSEAQARIEFGSSTFVVARRAETCEPMLSWLERVRQGLGASRRFLPLASAGMPLAAMATFLGAVPFARAVNDRDMRSAISADASTCEIKQHIQLGAQRQVASLYQCFDPLPLACQKAGFVGVGIDLAKTGEVQDRWVSASTYDSECPVAACMVEVVSGWYFEPMPQPTRLVIPIEIRRTNRPLYDPSPSVAMPVILTRGPFGDGGHEMLEVVAGD